MAIIAYSPPWQRPPGTKSGLPRDTRGGTGYSGKLCEAMYNIGKIFPLLNFGLFLGRKVAGE